MKTPHYYDNNEVDGFDFGDFCDMEEVIGGWRDGLCVFGKLDDGGDVPAKKVAAHARSIADMLVPESRLISEKPKLLKLAEYAERVAAIEGARTAIRRAAKSAKDAGIGFRESVDLFVEEVQA